MSDSDTLHELATWIAAWNYQSKLLNPSLVTDLRRIAAKMSEREKRIDELEYNLNLALDYLEAGKRQFAPNTTNSYVDEFLKRHGRMQEVPSDE